jgi:hypothetical protein
MLGTKNNQGDMVWSSSITPRGINASILNAGIINTDQIQIMNGNSPAFKWDKYGISALYDDTNNNSDKDYGFVRFDKYGLYGIKDELTSWAPDEIDPLTHITEKSTFALTWRGLQIVKNITGTSSKDSKIKLRIGEFEATGNKSAIMEIVNTTEGKTTPIFAVYTDGSAIIGGLGYSSGGGSLVLPTEYEVKGFGQWEVDNHKIATKINSGAAIRSEITNTGIKYYTAKDSTKFSHIEFVTENGKTGLKITNCIGIDDWFNKITLLEEKVATLEKQLNPTE